ncbi:MAG: transposase [Armatimonadetes bacterium]|nr:transposase [Armatimonadota bacterium]
MCGLSVEKFDDLLARFQPLWEATRKQRLTKRQRQRAFGGGRTHGLALEDQLLLTLIYYRHYTPHRFLEFLFGLDHTNIGRTIRAVTPVLNRLFRVSEHRADPGEGLDEERLRALFFDATEQPIQRPSGNGEQKRFYSGKKKRHTIKHQLVVDRRGKVLSVSPAHPGKVHDKKVYDRSRVLSPPGTSRKGDLGYLGTSLLIPHKKPKGGSLTEEQKQENRQHASERIGVEHAIGKMKVFKIVSERFRNPLGSHTAIFKNVAGLYNLLYF